MLPGHSSEWQDSSRFTIPGQCWGSSSWWLSSVLLDFVRVPPPHDFEHTPTSHALHSQCTRYRCNEIYALSYYVCWLTVCNTVQNNIGQGPTWTFLNFTFLNFSWFPITNPSISFVDQLRSFVEPCTDTTSCRTLTNSPIAPFTMNYCYIKNIIISFLLWLYLILPL